MNVALILSGGTGSRMGMDIPKQYIKINNKTILSYAIDIFETHPLIDKVQIVATEEWREKIQRDIGKKFQGFSIPGENRQLSILNGLNDLEELLTEKDSIVIHDAARPLVSADTVTELLRALDCYDAAIPMLPLKDTVYEVVDGEISHLLDRRKIMAGQAPEAFKYGKYLEANRDLLPDQILKVNGSTEVAFLSNMKVKCIPGDENNFKITTLGDLQRFEEIIQAKQFN